MIFVLIVFVLVYLQNPNDIAYVFSGYAPLTVRLAQFLARPQGWRGLEEVIRMGNELVTSMTLKF